MVVFCYLTEPNESMANKKYPKNEREGRWGRFLGDVNQRQGPSHLSVAVTVTYALRLVFGMPLKLVICELGQSTLDMLGQAAGCALTRNSRPAFDWSNEVCAWETEKESSS